MVTLPATLTSNLLWSLFKNGRPGPWEVTVPVVELIIPANTASPGSRTFGETTTPQYAQSFTPSADILLSVVQVPIAKTNSPTDNVTCKIYSDSSNQPGSLIATALGEAVGSALPVSGGSVPPMVSFQFTPFTLSTSTQYWVVLGRTGTLSDTNRYTWSASSENIAGWGYAVHNGTAWSGEYDTFVDQSVTLLGGDQTALYGVFVDTATYYLEIEKSIDGGETWNAVDRGAASPSIVGTGGYRCYDAVFDGTTIHIAYVNNNGLVVVRPFNCLTDSWGTVTANGSGYDPAATVDAHVTNTTALMLARRSDGDYIVLRQGDAVANMGTSYRRVTYSRYEGSTWTNEVDVSEASGTSVHSDLRAIAIDATDRVYLFYTLSSGSLRAATLSSSNVLTAGINVALGYNYTGNYSAGHAAVIDDSTDRIVCAFVNDTNDMHLLYANVGDAGSLSWSEAVVSSTNDPEYTNSNPASLAINGTTINVIWTDDVTQDLWQDSCVSGTWTFGTDTEILDAVTINGISANYLSGIGSGGVGYFYLDDTTIKYNGPSGAPPATPKNDTDSIDIALTESETVNKTSSKPDSDSLAITLAEAEVVRNAFTETDAVATTLTEVEVVRNVFTETDSLALTLTESEAVVHQFFKTDSDSLAVTLTESETVVRIVSKIDSDSLDITLTDVETLLGKPADVDSLAVTLSEVEVVRNAVADADALTLTLAETDVVRNVLVEPDSLAITLTESESVVRMVAKTDADTADVALSEAEVVRNAIAEIDALAVALTDVESLHAYQPEIDSLAITLTESETVTHQFFKTDTDSLALTITEADVVAASIAEVDSLAVTLTEAETILRQMFRVDTDSLALTLNETESVQATLAESDSLAVTLTETDAVAALQAESDALDIALTESESIEIVPGVTFKNDVDTLALILTEADTVAAALAEADAVAIDLTESETVFRINQRADVDTLAVDLTEADAVAATIAETDSLSIDLTEVEDVDKALSTASKNDVDTLSLTLTETDSVAAAIADTDALTLTLTEADAVAAALTEADALAVDLAEADSVTVAIAETDSLAITLTEVEDVTAVIQKIDSDSLALTLTEVSTVVKTISKTDTDSLALTLTETDRVNAAIAEADSLNLTLPEAEVVRNVLAETDVLDVPIVEFESVGAAIHETDSLAITLTESESKVRYIVETDTLDISLTESDLLSAVVVEVDQISVEISEFDFVVVAVFEVDILAVTLSEDADVTGPQDYGVPIVAGWSTGTGVQGGLSSNHEDAPVASWKEDKVHA